MYFIVILEQLIEWECLFGSLFVFKWKTQISNIILFLFWNLKQKFIESPCLLVNMKMNVSIATTSPPQYLISWMNMNKLHMIESNLMVWWFIEKEINKFATWHWKWKTCYNVNSYSFLTFKNKGYTFKVSNQHNLKENIIAEW